MQDAARRISGECPLELALLWGQRNAGGECGPGPLPSPLWHSWGSPGSFTVWGHFDPPQSQVDSTKAPATE